MALKQSFVTQFTRSIRLLRQDCDELDHGGLGVERGWKVYRYRALLERDIEAAAPDLATELVLYCGGGYRSALAAESLQKMGYTNVISMDGGVREWKEAGFPLQGTKG